MAAIGTKFGLGGGGGPIGGAPLPKIMSGAGIKPHIFQVDASSGLTTTATRLYYVPIYLPQIYTFAGMKTRNGNTSDNGDTFRMGLYAEATAGGPGSLVNDCGEVTLDASAAIRTLSSSFSNTAIGWHYMAFHSNQAVLINQMKVATANNVGSGGDGMPVLTFDVSAGAKAVLYVDTAYGALASTAVAPTASTDAGPMMFLFV